MSLSDRELEHLVPELAERLLGSFISNTWQPARDHVLLGFSDGTRLLLCPRGPDARLHTVSRRPTNPPRPFSFQGACRAHLSGPLTKLVKHPSDRVVSLWFGDHRLHLRLTGRSGGLWLLRDDRIIAAYDGPAPSSLPDLPEGEPRTTAPRMEPDPTWDNAVGRFYALRIRARREHELRIVVGRAVRRRTARLARLLQNLESDLDKADGASQVRRCADSLAANLHRVAQGPDHVDLTDLEDPDLLLRVPLFPDRSPARSLDRLYAKARRLDRMGDRVLERLEVTGEQLRGLRELAQTLDGLSLDELREVQEDFGSDSPARGKGKVLPGVTTWLGPSGQRVLVGRDAKANRRLTFQVAKGTDYWMHVRGRPGAHIVLPLKRGQTPSLELLLAAGQIAAVHAGVAHGDRVEVQYTRVRDVRSIPKTEAKVRVFNEKVLNIGRDPAELTGWERLGSGSG